MDDTTPRGSKRSGRQNFYCPMPLFSQDIRYRKLSLESRDVLRNLYEKAVNEPRPGWITYTQDDRSIEMLCVELDIDGANYQQEGDEFSPVWALGDTLADLEYWGFVNLHVSADDSVVTIELVHWRHDVKVKGRDDDTDGPTYLPAPVEPVVCGQTTGATAPAPQATPNASETVQAAPVVAAEAKPARSEPQVTAPLGRNGRPLSMHPSSVRARQARGLGEFANAADAAPTQHPGARRSTDAAPNAADAALHDPQRTPSGGPVTETETEAETDYSHRTTSCAAAAASAPSVSAEQDGKATVCLATAPASPHPRANPAPAGGPDRPATRTWATGPASTNTGEFQVTARRPPTPQELYALTGGLVGSPDPDPPPALAGVGTHSDGEPLPF